MVNVFSFQISLQLQAVETEVTCLTVKSLKSVLFQALSSQNRLEKRGEFKIARVKTLRATGQHQRTFSGSPCCFYGLDFNSSFVFTPRRKP